VTTADPTPLAPPALAGAWTLDPARTSITIHTKALWLLPVQGTAKAVEGGGTVSPDGGLSGSLVVEAASIDTKNKKRDEHLRGTDFFEVDKYPTITFQADAGTLDPSGQVELTGTLTLRGETRPLTLTGRVEVDGTSATLSVETEIDRSEWGVSWAKMGAGLKNRLVISAGFDQA
jgi:polyisoprenoid-binding protein YceI